MTFVALKMLVGDRLKYLGLIVGIAFAALLITQQSSILVGLASQTGAFIRDTSQADLWIMDDQVRFSQENLPMRDTILLRARGVEGVEWAMPLYQGFLRARLNDGTRVTMILVGLDDTTLMGGPPHMVKGALADLRQNNAVLVGEDDRATKWKLKRSTGQALEVGDRLTINDQDAQVVGTFRGSKSFFWEPVMYTTYSRALRYAPRERNLLAFVMVKVKPGYDHATVAANLAESTGLAVRSNAQFEQITADYILKETGILVNFGLAVGLGFVIGVLIAGQMLYNFTLDNLRYYGTLKAMGTGNAALVSMVLVQTLAVGILGYGIGVGAGALMGKLVGDAGLAFRMIWQIPVAALLAILFICITSALLCLRRVLSLEPAIVFKS
jgi:putative ABC transport system permease protein